MVFPHLTIITGHYGSGKTNIAVNFALMLKEQGRSVTIVDLDTVNTYFRTADFADAFAKNGIRLVAPLYANTNLDIPALNFDISAIVKSQDYVIIDVGGDEVGATALGQYYNALSAVSDKQMLYVINKYRYLTKEPTETLELMYEIERTSRLSHTGIINNSNLSMETTGKVVEDSLQYAETVAKNAKLPIFCTTVARSVAATVSQNIPNLLPIDLHVAGFRG